MNPILHIGFPKTATTWFQQIFYPSIQNIVFFDHQRILQKLGKDWRDIIEDPAFDATNILSTNKRTVICDESMIGGIRQLHIRAEWYKKVFSSAHVVLFIRNQMDKYLSMYSQYIKAGGTARFHDFIFPSENEIFAGEKHRYHNIIFKYMQEFGDKNVFVYLYEDFAAHRNVFIDEFLKTHQLEYNNKQLNVGKVNQSLSYSLLMIKRRANFFSKQFPHWTQNFSEKYSKYYFHIPFWSKFSLSLCQHINPKVLKPRRSIEEILGKEAASRLHSYFAESNNILYSKYGMIDIKKYNYPL